MNTTYLDISGVIETFDPDETRSLIQDQLDSLDDTDACMTDNFKLLYTRYATILHEKANYDSDVFAEAEGRFFNICGIFIEEISRKFTFQVDNDRVDTLHSELQNIALPLYLFFVLDLRSNLFEVLLNFICKNKDVIADNFDHLRGKHDAMTTSNRVMEDQNTALIASNIYAVVDWVLEQMDNDIYFESMDQSYVAYKPVKEMFESDLLSGDFVDDIRDLIKKNIALKARVCFDIISRLKGFM